MADGAFFSDADARSLRKVAVLGSTVAQSLFPDGGAVGQRIQLRNVPFLIRTLEHPAFRPVEGVEDRLVRGPELPRQCASVRLCWDFEVTVVEGGLQDAALMLGERLKGLPLGTAEGPRRQGVELDLGAAEVGKALLHRGVGPNDRNLDAIRRDARHSGMVEVRRRAIDVREFAEWSMLYCRGFEGHDEDLARLAANRRLDPQDERMMANFIALGRRRPTS